MIKITPKSSAQSPLKTMNISQKYYPDPPTSFLQSESKLVIIIIIINFFLKKGDDLHNTICFYFQKSVVLNQRFLTNILFLSQNLDTVLRCCFIDSLIKI